LACGIRAGDRLGDRRPFDDLAFNELRELIGRHFLALDPFGLQAPARRGALSGATISALSGATTSLGTPAGPENPNYVMARRSE
jgi:hypothetical protein